ncbi:MAG TPA: outer membrane beta-barrel protein [bacterium]|nr:outer membrane beta-barrel protein [bacterium]
MAMLPTGIREAFKDGLEVEMGVGPNFNLSKDLGRYWGVGAMLGLGWRLDDRLSADFVMDGSDFYSIHSASTAGKTRFSDLHLTVMAKYRFGTGDFRPYVLGGAGIGFNAELRESAGVVSDEVQETGWVLETGVGIEQRVNGDFFLYLQSGVIDDLLSPSFTREGNLGNPVVYVPLTAGIFFGR